MSHAQQSSANGAVGATTCRVPIRSIAELIAKSIFQVELASAGARVPFVLSVIDVGHVGVGVPALQVDLDLVDPAAVFERHAVQIVLEDGRAAVMKGTVRSIFVLGLIGRKSLCARQGSDGEVM